MLKKKNNLLDILIFFVYLTKQSLNTNNHTQTKISPNMFNVS